MTKIKGGLFMKHRVYHHGLISFALGRESTFVRNLLKIRAKLFEPPRQTDKHNCYLRCR